MNNPRMLYRAPGLTFIHDGFYETIVVDESVVKDHLGKGWFLTLAEAKAAAVPEQEEEPEDDSPPTRAEMEEIATKLGVRFDGRTSDELLAKRIENRMRENGSL